MLINRPCSKRYDHTTKEHLYIEYQVSVVPSYYILTLAQKLTIKALKITWLHPKGINFSNNVRQVFHKDGKIVISHSFFSSPVLLICTTYK